jgi:hypothetical protein
MVKRKGSSKLGVKKRGPYKTKKKYWNLKNKPQQYVEETVVGKIPSIGELLGQNPKLIPKSKKTYGIDPGYGSPEYALTSTSVPKEELNPESIRKQNLNKNQNKILNQFRNQFIDKFGIDSVKKIDEFEQKYPVIFADILAQIVLEFLAENPAMINQIYATFLGKIGEDISENLNRNLVGYRSD